LTAVASLLAVGATGALDDDDDELELEELLAGALELLLLPPLAELCLLCGTTTK
jgi:hypothetical protein